MIRTLSGLVNNGKYRESINYSYKIYNVLVSTYLGIPKTKSQTAFEYAERVIGQNDLPGLTIMGYTHLYEESRYSDHEITQDQYGQAMQYFAEIYHRITGGKIQLG